MALRNTARRTRAAAIATTIIAGLQGVAHAQDVSGASRETGVANAVGLEEVVVTARKRVESAQDIPVALTAISGAQAQRLDLSSLEKVAAFTPQLTVGRVSTGSGATLTLRGVGSNPSSIGIEQSVAVVVDGVYYGQGRVINEGFFDMSRLEILKGPQALFYGKNATAGVVSITTAQPTSKPEVLAKAGYEFNAQQVYGEFVASGPLSDTLSARVAVRGAKMFGGLFNGTAPTRTVVFRDFAPGSTAPVFRSYTAPPVDRDQPGEKELLARASIKWTPTDTLAATLQVSGNSTSITDPAANNLVFACVGGTSFLDPGQPCVRKFEVRNNNMPVEVGRDIHFGRDDGHLYNSYKSWGTTATISYEVAEHLTLTSVSNYNWNRNRFAADTDYQSAPSVYTGGSENTTFHAFSSELRALTSYDGPLNLLAGFYYQKSNRKYEQNAMGGNVENSAAPAGYRYVAFAKASHTDGETLSPYGQVTWKIVPQVELTAGVRYTHETKNSSFVHPYVNPALLARFFLGVPFIADQTFNNWSPEVTLTWKPSDGVTVYGSYRTAYKSGGFSNGGTYGPTARLAFDPEKAKGFEGGVKTTLFERQLRFNIGAYRYDYDNLQVDFFDSALFANITTNAGSARNEGIEVDWEYAPKAVSGLDIHGSVNYNHARYLDFIAPCYTGQTPAQGCNTRAFGTFGQDLSGVTTALAPRWTASSGLGYETEIGDRFVLGLSADAKYSAHYLASSFGQPLSRQPQYVTVDASVRLTTIDDRWELSILGKNLTNRYIINGSADATASGSGTGTAAGRFADQRGYIANPRTVQVQLTWRY